MIHVIDIKDGKGRHWYWICRVEAVPCPNIAGCWVTSDGSHIQNVFGDDEELPPRRYDRYEEDGDDAWD
jgi:hypothetical protein